MIVKNLKEVSVSERAGSLGKIIIKYLRSITQAGEIREF